MGKDLKRLGWTFAGAVLGLAVGFVAFIILQGLGGESLKQTMEVNGFLWVLLVGGCCVGGLIGGGGVALWIITSIERKQRKKYFDEKKARRKAKR